MEQQKIVITIVCVLLVLLAIASMVVAAIFTQGFQHEFSFVYVKVGDTKIMTDRTVRLGKVIFDVKTVLCSSDYKAEVLPGGKNFKYYVDGIAHFWLFEKHDMNDIFDLQQNKKQVSIDAKQISIQSVLESLYPGKTIRFDTEVVDTDPHFKLVFTSGKHSLALTFLCMASVEGIELPAEREF